MPFSAGPTDDPWAWLARGSVPLSPPCHSDLSQCRPGSQDGVPRLAPGPPRDHAGGSAAASGAAHSARRNDNVALQAADRDRLQYRRASLRQERPEPATSTRLGELVRGLGARSDRSPRRPLDSKSPGLAHGARDTELRGRTGPAGPWSGAAGRAPGSPGGSEARSRSGDWPARWPAREGQPIAVQDGQHCTDAHAASIAPAPCCSSQPSQIRASMTTSQQSYWQRARCTLRGTQDSASLGQSGPADGLEGGTSSGATGARDAILE
jgi:hypothetical protein